MNAGLFNARRQAIGRLSALTALTALAIGSRRVAAHNDAGKVVPPLNAPALPLTMHDGSKSSLVKAFGGRPTAVQLMFTGCSATCPIQGALFHATLKHLPPGSPVRLMSVSIDPLNDDPAAMRRWLKRYEGNELWLGATPDYRDVDRLLDFLRARNSGADRHTAQVYFFNKDGALVLRSTDFPASQEIARLLLRLTLPV